MYWLPYSFHISHHLSQTRCLPWISYATQKLMLDSCKMVEKQSEEFHTFLWQHFFQSLKQNFIAYHYLISNFHISMFVWFLYFIVCTIFIFYFLFYFCILLFVSFSYFIICFFIFIEMIFFFIFYCFQILQLAVFFIFLFHDSMYSLLLPMVRETRVQSQVELYQKLKK